MAEKKQKKANAKSISAGLLVILALAIGLLISGVFLTLSRCPKSHLKNELCIAGLALVTCGMLSGIVFSVFCLCASIHFKELPDMEEDVSSTNTAKPAAVPPKTAKDADQNSQQIAQSSSDEEVVVEDLPMDVNDPRPYITTPIHCAE